MRIIFDQGVSRPLRDLLPGHEIKTSGQMGWSELKNGDLLRAAEDAHFEALVTTDKQMRYQQNLRGRKIRILVLPTTEWSDIREHVESVRTAIDTTAVGEYREIFW
jgi:hypothetical protein